MRISEVRRFARSLPETTEEPHHDKASFRVRGKIFATVPPDEEHLHVLLDLEDAEAAVAESPASVELLLWGAKVSGVRITLAQADPSTVRELLEDAWRRRAPASLHAARRR